MKMFPHIILNGDINHHDHQYTHLDKTAVLPKTSLGKGCAGWFAVAFSAAS